MPTEPSPRSVRTANSRRHRRATGLLALAVATALALTACTSSGDSATSSSTSRGSAAVTASGSTGASSGASPAGAATVPTLAWAACPAADSPTAPDLSSFQCATASVPLDYADPSGKSIDLAVVRHPATDATAKIGTLFFNPGGPGGTGTGQFPAWFSFFPAELQRRFDIVSWDPRGIGESTATQCFDSADAEGELLGALPAFPIGAEQEKQWVDAYTQFGQQCAERAGELLEHVSTRDTARDLDLLRQAVGEDKINYLGISYGTFLGATYANLFPDTVRAMVFDGNVSPDAWTNNGQSTATESINTRIGSDVGVDSTLHDLLTLCGQTSTERCAFSAGSADATVQKWDTLLSRLQQQPATIGAAGAQKTVTYQALVSSIGNALDFVQAGPGIQGWTGAATVMQEIWEATEAAPASSPATSPSSSPAAPTPAAAGGSPRRRVPLRRLPGRRNPPPPRAMSGRNKPSRWSARMPPARR